MWDWKRGGTEYQEHDYTYEQQMSIHYNPFELNPAMLFQAMLLGVKLSGSYVLLLHWGYWIYEFRIFFMKYDLVKLEFFHHYSIQNFTIDGTIKLFFEASGKREKSQDSHFWVIQ